MLFSEISVHKEFLWKDNWRDDKTKKDIKLKMKNMGLSLYINNNQKISTTIEVKKISGVSPSYFRTPSLSFQKVSFLLIHYFMSEDNKKTLLSINTEWIGFKIISNFITVSS